MLANPRTPVAIAPSVIELSVAELSRLRIKPDARLRDQFDIDSMDFLNFIIGLHQELHVDIPERDYTQLMTLSGCINYLQKTTKD